jgi:DNA-binding NarL/FixJ family response regulator
VAILAGSTVRLEYALALRALGRKLRLDRRPTEAREPLREALAVAAACGADGLVEEIRAELRAAGVRPRTDTLAGPDALTPSERRIAELAAEALTNRDIAQQLFVTPKTVEVHLSAVYRKLGITSRRGLPSVMAAV